MGDLQTFDLCQIYVIYFIGQMRNRDAAVRSRERKKMLVRDLEMKSKYYEAECKRLGTLLECCLFENQALRLSMHSSQAFDASGSKQESVVLLLDKNFKLTYLLFKLQWIGNMMQQAD